MSLLTDALSMLPKHTITLRKQIALEEGRAGLDVPEYAEGIIYKMCALQPVSAGKKTFFGLDYMRNAYTLYVQGNVETIRTAGTSDLIEWGGRKFRILSNKDWEFYDGWAKCVIVEDQEGIIP